MTDDLDDHDDLDDLDDHDHHPHEHATERSTAPQSDYTDRDVLVGAVVAIVGLVVVFGVPFLLG